MLCRSTRKASGFGQEAKARIWGKPEPFNGVSKGKAKQRRANSIGLVSKNSSGRLWAIRLVSGCLVSGSGMIWTMGNMGLVCES